MLLKYKYIYILSESFFGTLRTIPGPVVLISNRVSQFFIKCVFICLSANKLPKALILDLWCQLLQPSVFNQQVIPMKSNACLFMISLRLIASPQSLFRSGRYLCDECGTGRHSVDQNTRSRVYS